MSCSIRDEELAQFLAGEAPLAGREELRRHVAGCQACAARAAALQDVDQALAQLAPRTPSGSALRGVRCTLAAEVQRPPHDDIMTLDEVAAFLRVPLESLEEFVDDLPAFEVAGRVRVRREQLTEWVARREREYAQKTTASWLSGVKSTALSKGVA